MMRFDSKFKTNSNFLLMMRNAEQRSLWNVNKRSFILFSFLFLLQVTLNQFHYISFVLKPMDDLSKVKLYETFNIYSTKESNKKE